MTKTNHFLIASALLLSLGCAEESDSGNDDSAETAEDSDAGVEDETSDSPADDQTETDDPTETDEDESDDEASPDDGSDDDASDGASDDENTDEAPAEDGLDDEGADDTDDDEPETDDEDTDGAADDEPEADDDTDDTADDESETDGEDTDDTDDDESEMDDEGTDVEAATEGDELDDMTTDDTMSDDETSDDSSTDEETGEPETVIGKNAIFQFTQQHQQLLNTPVISGGAFAAYFVETEIEVRPVEEVDDPCVETRVGACAIRTCPELEADPEPVDSPIIRTTELQPESVSVTGLLVDPIEPDFVSIWELNGIEPPQDQDLLTGYTAQFLQNILWWSDDQARIIVEPSADVPEFDISFDMPNVPELTSPSSISTSAALELTWTNTGLGNVHIGLSGQDANGTARSIMCEVPSSTGAVSIAASLMDGLEASGFLTVATLLSTTGQQGDWLYSVSAQDQGVLRQVTFSD